MKFTTEFLNELTTLCLAHGIVSSFNGVEVTLTDPDVAGLRFAQEAKFFGLEAEDLGKVFVSQGRRFKLTGVKSSRPKYPISAKCVMSGKAFKFPRAAVAEIIKARANAKRQAERLSPSTNNDDRYADSAMF